MSIIVTGKNIDVGDALRAHIETTLTETVERYFTTPFEAHVTLTRDAYLFRADVHVHARRGMTLHSNGAAVEAYPAFDEALDVMNSRLRRYKKKLRDHHQASADTMFDVPYAVFTPHQGEEEVTDNPVIVAEMTNSIERMSVSEAVARLDMCNAPAILFFNSAHGGVNMVYRRHDGHIGWVDPSAAVQAKAAQKSA